jgi:hypothetical protein
MRGRLIQRFKAEIARIDTEAIDSGDYYDEDFREVVYSVGSSDGIGTLQRQEHDTILVPVQIGTRTFEALQAFDQGNAPETELVMHMHFADLERLSLVETSTGEPLIHTGDRLVSIKRYFDEALVLSIRTPPGLYVVEATSAGWGINMAQPTRNLLRVKFEERSAAI